jgi:hypothetical protein
VTDWGALNHAYGSAADIPALLGDLSPDPNAEVWGELWSRVCHQDSVYSASFPVLPHLLQAAGTWPPTGRLMPLSLAAGIVSSPDRNDVGDTSAYGPTVQALHRLALETLSAAQGLSAEDVIYLLHATLALGGDRLWAGRLDLLSGGELPGTCPACQAMLYLVIGEYGFFTAADEWVNRPETPRVPIEPAEVSELPQTGRWLHDRAMAAGQPAVADWIQHLFGSTRCPACGAPINVADAASGW